VVDSPPSDVGSASSTPAVLADLMEPTKTMVVSPMQDGSGAGGAGGGQDQHPLATHI
jgi:hypothetical protein